ncbi:2-oxoacid:acceptor oxidoreductase [Neisseria animalis]|uniref:2-oxoacid:acceptor oxidoreductase n=1 Tax=Neisseria animalis TaxID=492 RepID=A0A5P3MPR7_NEIAN|nr:2-oxoacid:acceptor oxidoreductase [Neisseria animalis]QEY23543.1 2-oxoacid:acceptor oxidoreductase [Neisseria animalis]ROW32143.1 2-oxoacid:acceptor oxidoreductase [Neisseria animalis]VEE09182.1 putative phage associated protein [Neisseria animalis]
MPKLFEIFKSGTRTDHNGRRITISDGDVAQAAAAYDPALFQAPIVIGHPHSTAPAYGWVGSLKADGGVLSADFAQMDEGFVDLVKAGRYKKVSASFYPPDNPNNPKPGVWYLRHVGFLGAVPPAVKGLAAIDFAEDDGAVSFGGADEPAPPENPLSDLPEHEHKETPMSPEELLAQEKAAREAAEARAADAVAELEKLKAEQERDLRDAAHQRNTDFAEGLVKEGRLKPADKDLAVRVLDFAEYPEHYTVEFGENTLTEALRSFFSNLPNMALNSHLAKGRPTVKPAGLSADFAEAADPEALSHHERALALAEKEGIDYAEAARRTAAV